MNCWSKLSISVTVACALAATGCSTTRQANEADADKVAAYPLTQRGEVERIDLAQLIYDEAKLGCKLDDRDLAAVASDSTVSRVGERVDQAFGCFNEFARTASYAAVTRNQIQERLLAASEQRCADFKALLHRKQSNVNFFTGVATSAFAAAGSITRSVEGARTLAGLSGLSSAYGAEYNQAYFSNLAAHVAVAGIDLHRSRIYEQILSQGKSKSIDDYPLQAAIKDAFKYHAACSIMTGLVEAQNAIKTVESPGLAILQRATVKNKFLQALNAATPAEVPKTIEAWKDVMPTDVWLAGVPLVNTSSLAPPDPAKLAIQYRRVAATNVLSGVALGKYAKEVLVARADSLLLPATTATVNAAKDKFTTLTDAATAAFDVCKPKVLAKSTENLALIAEIAVAPDDQARDTLAVKSKYLGLELDAIASALTSSAFIVTSCDNALRRSLALVVAAPKDDSFKITAANTGLAASTAACAASVAVPAICKP